MTGLTRVQRRRLRTLRNAAGVHAACAVLALGAAVVLGAAALSYTLWSPSWFGGLVFVFYQATMSLVHVHSFLRAHVELNEMTEGSYREEAR